MNDGRLPKPKGRQSDRVIESLRLYRDAYCTEKIDPTVRRHAKAILDANIKIIDSNELAHYYAGVRLILVSE